jgi:hypothetical protein
MTDKELETWESLQRDVKLLKDETERARKKFQDFEVNHLVVNPLLDALVERVAVGIESGTPICCSDGHENLSRIYELDPIWTKVLSSWAGKHLRCCTSHEDYFKDYAEKFREYMATVKRNPDGVRTFYYSD